MPSVWISHNPGNKKYLSLVTSSERPNLEGQRESTDAEEREMDAFSWKKPGKMQCSK